MSKFPKTVAEIQTADRSHWRIGDALIAECGVPPGANVNDNSRAKLEAAAKEIEGLRIEGYTVNHLSNLRRIAHNFPAARRSSGVSWAAHCSAGTPEMLEMIAKSVGSKPVTNAVARSMKPVIEKQQERKFREENPDRKTPPKRNEMPDLSIKEVRGLALEAESLRYNNKILGCRGEMEDVAEWLEKNLDKLSVIAVDYLVETALSLAEDARRIADVARKLKAGRRAHLSVVGE